MKRAESPKALSQGIALGINVLFRCEALCGTEQNDSGIDSIKLEEYTAVLGNRVSLDSITGTYYGVLPPNVETTLTLNADGTYLLIQTFKEKQNEQEKLRGTFQVLDGNILMLVHPSSGDNIFYKVMEDNSIIFIDSFGHRPWQSG